MYLHLTRVEQDEQPDVIDRRIGVVNDRIDQIGCRHRRPVREAARVPDVDRRGSRAVTERVGWND